MNCFFGSGLVFDIVIVIWFLLGIVGSITLIILFGQWVSKKLDAEDMENGIK